MAEEKQVLLSLNVDISKSIEQMARYEQEIDAVNARITEYQKKQKEGISLSSEEHHDLTRLKELKKALQKEYSEESRQVQNSIIANQKYEGTLKGMCAELSLAKDVLRAMKTTDPGWEQQRQYVDDLNSKIKELEQSYGVYSRDVGHYRTEQEKTKEQIAQTIAQMKELIASHRESSPEMQKATEDLEKYNNTLASQGKNSLDAANNGISVLVGALGFLSMAFKEDTSESEKMQKLINNLTIAITALSIVSKLYDEVQKKGLIQKIAMTIQTKLATKAVIEETRAEAGSTTAKIAGAVAQKALNSAMLANPVGIIVAGVLALVAGLVALVSWLVKSTDAQKAANKAMKDYEETIRVSENELAALDANENARAINTAKRYQDEIAMMTKSGATKEAIDKKKKEMENALLGVEMNSNRERMKIQEREMKKARENYNAQLKLLEEMKVKKGEDAKATKKQQEATDEAHKSFLQYMNAYNNTIKALNDAEYTKSHSAYEAAQNAAEKAYARAQSRLSTLDKLTQDSISRRYKFIYDYTKSAEENDAEKFRLSAMLEQQSFYKQQEMQKKKLDLDRKYGKITAEEYKNSLAEMQSDLKSFLLNQSKSLAEYTREVLNKAIQNAGGKSLDGRLAEVKSKYDESEKAIRESLELSEEEKSFYLINLEKARQSEIKSVRQSYSDQITKYITDSINDEYKRDLRQFSADEEEKLSLAIEKQKKLIDEKKKAGQDTLADDVQLAQLKYDIEVAATNKQLAIAWKSADEQYSIQKEFIQKQLKLANLSAEQRAKLEQDLAYLTAEYNQQKIDQATEYASQCMDIFSSLNEVIGNLETRYVSKYEKDNNEKKDSLDKRLKAGLISQKQYDKEVEKADEDLDKKKADIERKAAIRQKAMSAMQIALNTATAIMKIWAEVPKLDFGVSTAALTAVAAAVGAAQLAAVLSEPLPKAKIGGLVQGQSHEQGGVLVNMEGGERIVSQNPSRVFPELLNLISWIGKHSSIPDTGYGVTNFGGGGSVSSNEPLDYERLAAMIGEKISQALQDNPPRISIDEYERERKNYAKIEDLAKI